MSRLIFLNTILSSRETTSNRVYPLKIKSLTHFGQNVIHWERSARLKLRSSTGDTAFDFSSLFSTLIENRSLCRTGINAKGSGRSSCHREDHCTRVEHLSDVGVKLHRATRLQCPISSWLVILFFAADTTGGARVCNDRGKRKVKKACKPVVRGRDGIQRLLQIEFLSVTESSRRFRHRAIIVRPDN